MVKHPHIPGASSGCGATGAPAAGSSANKPTSSNWWPVLADEDTDMVDGAAKIHKHTILIGFMVRMHEKAENTAQTPFEAVYTILWRSSSGRGNLR